MEVYAYGLEIILGGSIFKIGLLFLIASILNIFFTTLSCTMGFVGIRFFGGGGHFCTYTRCLAGSLAILLLLGKIAALNLNSNYIFILIFFNISLGIMAIIKWIPAGTHKKTVIDKKLRTKQKLKTLIMFITFMVIVLIFAQFQLYPIALSVLLGILASFILITPLGYFLLQSIDKLLDLLNQKKDADLAK
jgi:accessory gene regulator B